MATYEQYQAMLRVNKHRLDDELELQAQVMEEISTATTKYNARMLEAKLDLDKVESRLTADLREDEPKMTVGEIAGKLKRDPERITAWQKYLNCLSDYGKWSGLQEAWKQKGYSIKTLADLYGAQYFQLTSTQIRERHDRPENQTAKTMQVKRDLLREASEEAGRLREHNKEPEFKATLVPPSRQRRSVSDD